MKKIFSTFIIIAILFSFVIPLSGCSDKIDGDVAFTTDLHIIANSLINDENYEELSSQDKMVQLTEAITNTMVDEIVKNRIKVLLIGGDIAERGDEESHLAAAKIFARLEQKGVKVLVINGNHDVPAELGGSKITSSRFSEIYADFGYNEALDTYITDKEGTLSYTADIDKRSRLIAVDDIVHNEVNEDGSIGEYNKTESISNDHIDWIIAEVKKCIKDGKKPIIMTHISLMNHFPQIAQTLFDSGDHLQYNKLLEMLADNGAKYILTGHYHFQDSLEYVSKKSNKLYEVETASLSFYPCAYRQIDIKKGEIDTYTRYINNIDESYLPSAISQEDRDAINNDFPQYCIKCFDNKMESMINAYATNDGVIGEMIDGIEDPSAKQISSKLFDIIGTVVNSPFYIKDEDNNTSLERILEQYNIEIGHTDTKNLMELLPKMAEKLFYGDENLQDSEEIQIINYSIYSLFYYLNMQADEIYNLNTEYPKVNINLEKLFVNGELECYESNLVAFAVSLTTSINEDVGEFLGAFIEKNFSKYNAFISPAISYATKGLINGKDISPYINIYSIMIGQILNDEIWGNYAKDYILDNPPADNKFSFEWKI
ncbi:MAG: metallophosphoesterase [Clostridia bacterium]